MVGAWPVWNMVVKGVRFGVGRRPARTACAWPWVQRKGGHRRKVAAVQGMVHGCSLVQRGGLRAVEGVVHGGWEARGWERLKDWVRGGHARARVGGRAEGGAAPLSKGHGCGGAARWAAHGSHTLDRAWRGGKCEVESARRFASGGPGGDRY